MLKGQPQQDASKPRTVFAALARVSSEKSERQGESLTNQKAFIANSVKAMGGDPERDIVWDYCGQEHTMSDRASHERKLLKGLMGEVEGGPPPRFQAVMVQYLDRIGRNKKAFDALIELLQEHDVALYVGSSPLDLDDEADGLNVGMQAEFSHYWARRTLRSSMAGKIAKAKKGIYVQGPKIYGHERDEKGVWRADPVLRKKLGRAVAQLNNGERFRTVAEKAGLEWTSLYKGLRRAGSVIKCSLGTEAIKKYSRKRGNGFEYEVKVEPLVRDEEALKRVLARIDANAKKFGRRPRADKDRNRVDFSLKGLVRCGRCGYVMPNHVVRHKRVADSERKRKRRPRNPEGKNYYYQHALWYGCYKEYRKEHPKGTKRGAVEKPFPFNAPAEKLDVAACAALFVEMDTQQALTNALDQSQKDSGKEQKLLQQKLQELQADVEVLKDQKRRLINAIKNGLQLDKDLAGEVKSVNDQLALKGADIDAVERQLQLMDSPSAIKAHADAFFGDVRRGMKESLKRQMEHGLKQQWKALTEPDSETGKMLSVKERAVRRAQLLTNAQRRGIMLPLLEEPGCGVFVYKRKDGLHGKLKARGYPDIEFRI